MNVCLISHGADLGGAERCLLELAIGLTAQQAGVGVIVPRPGALSAELTRRGIRVAVVRMASWMSPAPARRLCLHALGRAALHPAAAFRIARVVRRWDCQIICTSTITLCAGALAAWWCRRPHVWFLHEFGQPDHGLQFDFGSALSLALIARTAALIIANSVIVRRYYRRFLRRADIAVVYPCASSVYRGQVGPPLAAAPGTELRCLFAGGWNQGKRAEEALQAIAALGAMGVQPWLWILGDGTPERRAQLETMARQCGAARFVEFVGWVPDPSPWFQAADCLLMCSRAEAFGRVTLQAMRAGKPVVGARRGATPELIRDGVEGLLYAPGRPLELAAKLLRLVREPDLARQLGERARRRAEADFPADGYCDQVLRLFEAISRPAPAVRFASAGGR